MALLIALGMLIVVFFLNFMKKNDILTMAVLSLSAIVELIAIYVEPSSRVPVPVDPIFFLHIVLSAVSYAVLGLAAVQSMLFFELHRWLRSRDDLGKATLLPPLDFVETTNFRLILVGEILLTIAIVSAFFFYGELLDRLSYLPHVVLAVAAWLVYLVLLIGHYRLGWRSKCTYWSILAFLLVIACYIGLKILTPTIS